MHCLNVPIAVEDHALANDRATTRQPSEKLKQRDELPSLTAIAPTLVSFASLLLCNQFLPIV